MLRRRNPGMHLARQKFNSHREFAEAVGVAESTISRKLYGESAIGYEDAVRIERAARIPGLRKVLAPELFGEGE
jgi:transcriptional regulator with XRE-family HTH domain